MPLCIPNKVWFSILQEFVQEKKSGWNAVPCSPGMDQRSDHWPPAEYVSKSLKQIVNVNLWRSGHLGTVLQLESVEES